MRKTLEKDLTKHFYLVEHESNEKDKDHESTSFYVRGIDFEVHNNKIEFQTDQFMFWPGLAGLSAILLPYSTLYT